MSKKQAPPISAQVLLKPSTGAMPRDADITAANIDALTPEPHAAEAVRTRLAAAGFELGPLVGPSFSITAPPSVFKRFFRLTSPGSDKGEISLDHLPESVRRGVAAVTFPPPPDFGPGNFS